ncbi:hypothetical protein MHU86_2990 [Fragilaria crotonensis]|nr:hypothetical protein MHU86_2990 [Fragilaria crotonensis]
MSTHPTSHAAPPRTSARLEARQNRGAPGWITPAGGNEEKRLIMALVDYLHDASEDLAVLRYLTKEYRAIASTMNTIPTVRKVRKRLTELGVPYLQYDYSRKKWMYWNDYSETGMIAWQDQAESSSTDEDEGNQDEEEKHQQEEHEDQLLRTQSTSGGGHQQVKEDVQDKGDPILAEDTLPPPEHRQSVATSVTQQQADKFTSPDPPTDKDPPATRNAPLDPSAPQDTAEEAYEDQSSQSSSPLLTPRMDIATRTSRPGHHPAWFSSPTPIRNPYTGQQMQIPLPTRLQHMVQELQDHDDWFADEDNDGTTPETAIHVDEEDSSPMKQHRRRPTPPPTDEDGFITVPPHRNERPSNNPITQRAVPPRPTPPKTQQNTHQVTLDTVMETLSEHARTLEHAAMIQHRNRMDQAKEELQVAVKEAIEQIKQAGDAQCVEQKQALDRYCGEQMESLISDLDNFAGQAQRIQQEILQGVRDGTDAARTVPIDDEEEIPAAVTGQPGRKQQGKATVDNSDTVPTQRWTRVDYEEITKGGMHQSPTTQEDRYASNEYHLLKLRSTSTPTQLQTKDRKAVVKFYNAFIDFLKQYRVPIKTFDQIRIEHLEDPAATINPPAMEADLQQYQEYSAAIYARLEEDGVLDPSEPVYRGLLQMYNRTRDGYRLLKSLLAATLMVDAKNISQLSSTPPPVDSTIHPYEYASQLQEFFQFQMEQQRHYTEREQAMMFLQGMQQVRMYAAAATQLMHDLEQHPLLGSVPHKFVFPALPITLASHPAALPMPSTNQDTYTPARLNVTRAQADSKSRSNAPSNRSTLARNRRDSAGTRPPQKDTQCSACATYGHEVADCKVLPKVAACLAYQEAHTSMVQAALQRYRKLNHPTNRQTRQQTRAMVASKLQGHLLDSDNIDIDELVDDITESLHGYEDDDDNTNEASLYQMQATTQPCEDLHTRHSLIQPVKFPLFDQVQSETHAQTVHEETCWNMSTTDSTVSPTSISVSVSAIQQRDLADTGASVSATGL